MFDDSFQIDYAKASIDSANQSIVSTAGDAKEKLWTTWNDWTTTEGEEDKGAEDEEVKDTVISHSKQLTLLSIFEVW